MQILVQILQELERCKKFIEQLIGRECCITGSGIPLYGSKKL